MGWGRINVHVTMHNMLLLRNEDGVGWGRVDVHVTMRNMLMLRERMGWGGVGHC